jgi:hypothetical protein
VKTSEAEYVSACTERHEGNTRGHVWRREEYDPREVDIFGFCSDDGFHNGPVCVVCGYGFCHHCNRNGPTADCPGEPEQTEDEKRLTELYGGGVLR